MLDTLCSLSLRPALSRVLFEMLSSCPHLPSLCAKVHSVLSFDMRLTSFFLGGLRCCCTFPEAPFRPAASRPSRDREFRHARCESRTLADGFPLERVSS